MQKFREPQLCINAMPQGGYAGRKVEVANIQVTSNINIYTVII